MPPKLDRHGPPLATEVRQLSGEVAAATAAGVEEDDRQATLAAVIRGEDYRVVHVVLSI